MCVCVPATQRWWLVFSSSWWLCCGSPESLVSSPAGRLSLKSNYPTISQPKGTAKNHKDTLRTLNRLTSVYLSISARVTGQTLQCLSFWASCCSSSLPGDPSPPLRPCVETQVRTVHSMQLVIFLSCFFDYMANFMKSCIVQSAWTLFRLPVSACSFISWSCGSLKSLLREKNSSILGIV